MLLSPPVRRSALVFVLLAVACGDEVRIAHAPTAFAGFDRVVRVGEEVVLDASLSSDPDGDPLGFAWKLDARPTNSDTRLDSERGVLARFLADAPGIYVASLEASDEDFVARDLVSITATEAPTSSVAITLSPAVCQTDRSRLDACGGLPGRVRLTASATGADDLEWRFLRIPTALSEADLDPEIEGDTFTFTPPRPGDYWIAARARTEVGHALAVAAVGVFDGDAATRPVARITAPARARRGNFVLFDGRASSVATSTSVRRDWVLESGPADPNALDAFATGCPPDQCRRLIPMTAGTYIVSHRITVNGRAGVRAVATVEVE